MMTLIPYLVSFIAGTIGWAVGKKLGGVFSAAVVSIVLTGLGFYYSRKWVKDMHETLGGR
jgi:hypothetical protein